MIESKKNNLIAIANGIKERVEKGKITLEQGRKELKQITNIILI